MGMTMRPYFARLVAATILEEWHRPTLKVAAPSGIIAVYV